MTTAPPDPEPGAEYVEPTCPECAREMVLHAHWRKAGEEERAELLDEGYVREHHRGGICMGCRDPKSLLPTRCRKAKPGETIAKYIECREAGMTDMSEIAEKIGIQRISLRKAVRKARVAGKDLP